jgi:hypothetical protein
MQLAKTDANIPLLAQFSKTIAESEVLHEQISVVLGATTSLSLAPSNVETFVTMPVPTPNDSGANPLMGHCLHHGGCKNVQLPLTQH